MFPSQWPLGLLLISKTKSEHGIFIFKMCNDFSVFCENEDETGTDESAQGWTWIN